jgi:hypothetical protein
VRLSQLRIDSMGPEQISGLLERPSRASGMLEAISLDGVVLSVEDRVVFIPRESVLQMELYETRGRGSRLRLERDTPEPADPSDPGSIGTE